MFTPRESLGLKGQGGRRTTPSCVPSTHLTGHLRRQVLTRHVSYMETALCSLYPSPCVFRWHVHGNGSFRTEGKLMDSVFQMLWNDRLGPTMVLLLCPFLCMSTSALLVWEAFNYCNSWSPHIFCLELPNLPNKNSKMSS